MKKILTDLEKQKLILEFCSNYQNELANDVFKTCGRNENKLNEVTYAVFDGILNRINYSIYQKFNEYNESGKYTNALQEFELSDRDKAIFINNLTICAALIVTNDYFAY